MLSSFFLLMIPVCLHGPLTLAHLETCSSEEYVCDDGMCIPLTFYCDGEEHCLDGSDEKDCGKS